MSEEMEYNPDLYTLVDEEGVEHTIELLDVMEVDDDRYFALMPYYEDPEDIMDDTAELIVLKSQMDENDEELMISIDDEEEYQRIGQMFLEKLSTYFDGEEE